MWTTKKIFTSPQLLVRFLLISVVLLLVPLTTAHAMLGFGGFGGRVLTVKPCFDYPGKMVVTILPALPTLPFSLLWFPPPATRTY